MRTDRISPYASLSMLFALAETLLPHPIPILRYGLANIPLLSAIFILSGKEFLLLSLIKGIAVSLLSGTLFSPIGLMSTAQSIAAGLTMLAAKSLLKERISVWGISALGAFSSTLVQLLLARIYLGKGILSLMPWMLLLSILSGLLTAWLSTKLTIKAEPSTAKQKKDFKGILPLITLIAVTAAASASRNLLFLALLFMGGIVSMLLSHKRFMLLPWINILLISILSAVLTPVGEVLFRVFSFPVTRDAILQGTINALRIASTVAWSLSLSGRIRIGGMIGETFSLFAERQNIFFSHDGKLIERLKAALA